MIEHLRSAEDVAVSFTGECEPAGFGLCANHKAPLRGAKTCLHVLDLADLIRARDAEVTEAVRAVLDAWTAAGPEPGYHRAMQQIVRRSMPVLGAALDRATR